jgi:hypothetical protein
MKLIIPALAVTSAFLASSVSAATVGYWRFEDGNFLGDSVGSNTLTNNTTVTSVSSTFSDPIPQTGAANEDAASFGSSNYLTAADNAAFTSGTFTLEGFFSTTTLAGTGTYVIAGHFGSGGSFNGQRSFAVGTNGTNFRLLLSSAGTGTRNFDAFTLATNTNYYFAATVDMTDSGSSAINLYLQNLTAATALQSANFSKTAGDGGETLGSSVFNATAPFSIGSTAQGSANFSGTIDEIRLSNTKLAEGALLITAVPEPSTVALAIIGGLATIIFVRRRRLA